MHYFSLQMNRKHTVSNVVRGKDTFCVTVNPQVDYMFVAALVVILEEIHREREEQQAGSGDGSSGVADFAAGFSV